MTRGFIPDPRKTARPQVSDAALFDLQWPRLKMNKILRTHTVENATIDVVIVDNKLIDHILLSSCHPTTST
jgi:hypothetical protein